MNIWTRFYAAFVSWDELLGDREETVYHCYVSDYNDVVVLPH